NHPPRALALGVALLLVREALARGPVPWWRGAAWVGALGLVLMADSPLRVVGDGHEYVAMAVNLATGRPPALSDGEREQLESEMGWSPGVLSALPGRAALVGADGRQDFYHFWLYPALTVPAVAVARAVGGRVLAAFAATNLALLVLATLAVQRRAGPAALAVLFASPLLWWVDKPHPEVFFVAVVAAALALADECPQWALLLAGLAAAQNGVFLPPLAVATAWAWFRHRRRRFLLPSAVIAWGLAAASPLYYLHHLGRTSPLAETVLVHLPGPRELWAVLGDPNLGLFPAWPSMAIVALAGVVIALLSVRRRAAGAADAVAVLLATLALLVAFTQPGNLNHGGTRGMSRYALWLAAFALPVLARLSARTDARASLPLAALGALSVASLVPEYLPSRPARYLEPTPLARWLWTRHPGLDHPLPEVFAERAWGYPPLGSVPASTPRCEKALVSGDGTGVGRWPLACEPAQKPEPCRRPGALCYVDGGPNHYRFVRAPSQPTWRQPERRRWFWSGAPGEALAGELRELPWTELGIVDPKDEGVFFARRHAAGRVQLRTAPGAYLAWLDGPKSGAWVVPRVRNPAHAVLLDPLTGRELSRTRLQPSSSESVELTEGSPLLLVVVDERRGAVADETRTGAAAAP
ncbi:MAG TPA: hypothetical protein VEQ10_07360, partial [Vicinamibacteria bacterium]|nr:hypothetical protein [Vicinamibacteria bacterium]